MHSNEILFFSVFLIFVLVMLMVDLLFVSSKSHVVAFREAIVWTVIWVSFAMIFYILLRFHGTWLHGIENFQDLQHISLKYKHPIHTDGLSLDKALSLYKKNLGLEFLTGYLIEYSLSVDNVFVMILVFIAFGVKEQYYKRVLFWGILGAIVMRFIFIFVSAALIQRFSWILYVFGAFLVVTGVRMFVQRNKKEKIEPHKHPVVKFASKYFSVYPRFMEHHFFIRNKRTGKLYITPLLLVLLVIEFMDVIFAVDSVPAIFSVTKDPYIVFFSNIFAIIGLRSLFFLVMHVINYFHYLKTGLAVLLTFIGFKLLAPIFMEDGLTSLGFATQHSLYVVLGIIVVSIVLSLIFPKKES